jgi:hypothetical protein
MRHSAIIYHLVAPIIHLRIEGSGSIQSCNYQLNFSYSTTGTPYHNESIADRGRRRGLGGQDSWSRRRTYAGSDHWRRLYPTWRYSLRRRGRTDDISDCRGVSSSDLIAGWLGGDGNGGEGGEEQPSICGICLFLAKTAA